MPPPVAENKSASFTGNTGTGGGTSGTVMPPPTPSCDPEIP